MKIQFCNENKLECVHCAFARIAGKLPTDFSCSKFRNKPIDVYFEGAECPEFESEDEDYADEAE